MIVLDLYSGTGSSTAAFKKRGHTVVRVELDRQHEAHHYCDIGALDLGELRRMVGGRHVDFVWASPPCTAFSVASIGRHWASGGDNPVPKSPQAEQAQRLVLHTLALIGGLAPSYWLMENPRGMLRKLPFMRGLERWTVTYCQYGDERMKPTDLWGRMPLSWIPRPPCKSGDFCHDAAPRGSKTGTQGRKGAVDRARVPLQLSAEVCAAIEHPLTGRSE